MPDPYLIVGPALISFSGGRTSAYMLHEIIRAHGGRLPDDVVPVFANTGKEREETLRFVHECESRWAVRVRWLEYRERYGPMADRFAEVTFETASRAGEPMAALIAAKKYTPNSLARFCTEELKVKTLRWFAEVELGWTSWGNVIGLRHDEGWRVLKALDRNESGKAPWRSAMPLSKAKVTRADVMAFWAGQPFDLGLQPHEGNCDLCFLKGRKTLKALIRERPGVADWWIEQERVGKGSFSSRFTYADLVREVREQPDFFHANDDGDLDAECGLICGGDAA